MLDEKQWFSLSDAARSALARAEDSTERLALPEDSAERKDIPMCTGALDYFPAAIAYLAKISKFGNDKHNPGEPMHHARGKSMDHADCIIRHMVDRGKKDENGIRHSGYVFWRAAAQLQEELEREEGAPLPRGARLATCEGCGTPETCVNGGAAYCPNNRKDQP